METNIAAKKKSSRLMARYGLTWGNTPPERASYAVYVLSRRRGEVTPLAGIPKTQEDVDAIPVDRRGLSFFTSMPAPDYDLVDIEIPVGSSTHTVFALPEEVEAMRDGKMPLVRCFAANGKVAPWYEWRDYHPYVHYFAAESDDWTWSGCRVVACWTPVESLRENIDSYYEAACDTASADDVRLDWMSTATGAIAGRVVRSGLIGSRKSWANGLLGIARRRRTLKPASTIHSVGKLVVDDFEGIRSELADILLRIETLSEAASRIYDQADDSSPLMCGSPGAYDEVGGQGALIGLRRQEVGLRRKLDRMIDWQLSEHLDLRCRLIKAVGVPWYPSGALQGAPRSGYFKTICKRTGLVPAVDKASLKATIIADPKLEYTFADDRPEFEDI